ncbi:MAG: hypothetical protein IT304_07635 [Dehalococcoidia bacterium]|nr:hypothetical protein [Dehalococcoidia bacterium]
MLLLLYGNDGAAIRRRLGELQQEADRGTGMLATNFVRFDGRDARPAEILAAAMAPPFLAPHRLIVVENLLDRFEQRRQQRAPRSLDPLAPLFDGLAAGIPESTMLVFTGGTQRGNPLLDRLKKIPGVRAEDLAAPTGEALLRYIREEAALRGLRFRSGPSHRAHFDSPEWLSGRESVGQPAALVALLTQGDTLAIASELDKLALYTLGREATVDDVFDVCAGERLVRDFALVDAVLDGALEEALAVLPVAMRDLDSSQPVVGQLASAYRTVGVVVELLEDGASPEAIGQAIRRPYPKLREAAIRRARRLGAAGVRQAFEILVGLDRSVKLGEVRDDVALEVAIMRLCALAGGLPGPKVRVRTAR